MKEDQLGVAANFGNAWKNRGTAAKHGTRQRYKMGCKCRPCTTAATRYRALHKHPTTLTHDDVIDMILEVLAS